MTTFDIAGDGQPIMFLHAALGDRRMWHPQWSAFSGTNRLLRVDIAVTTFRQRRRSIGPMTSSQSSMSSPSSKLSSSADQWAG